MKKYIAKKLIDLAIWARWKSGELYPEPKAPFPNKSRVEIDFSDTHVNFIYRHFLALDRQSEAFGMPNSELIRISERLKELMISRETNKEQ